MAKEETKQENDIKGWNIYQRMSAATTEIGRVAKNLSVGFGNSSYRAVGEADVLSAVKPVEAKFGIYSYPYSREIVESGVLETVSEYQGKSTTKKQFYMRISTVYRFVNVDKPDEYIDITTYGDGVDSQDKSPGKCQTYADKYALLKAFKIETGDDPDQNASADMKGYQRGQRKSPDAPAPIDTKISEKEVEIIKNMCERAGMDIKTTFPKGVENLTIEQYPQAVQSLSGFIQKKEGK